MATWSVVRRLPTFTSRVERKSFSQVVRCTGGGGRTMTTEMTKDMRARANAALAVGLATLAVPRALANSVGARPEQWTVDERPPRILRVARPDVPDPATSCIAM